MKNILIVTRFFYPAYEAGGPIRSLTNLVDAIGTTKKIDVVCGSRDLGSNKNLDGINVNSWGNSYKNSRVYYIENRIKNWLSFVRTINANRYDIIYLNSFFDFKFTILFLLLSFTKVIKAKKIVVAPRGELSIGAMSIKAKKKIIYTKLFNRMVSSDSITYHFTSDLEFREASKYIDIVKHNIVPNMHEPIKDFCYKNKRKGSVNIIYLARISQKKNLIEALESMSKIDSGHVNFTIAGSVDDRGYWSECEHLISKLPKNINVSYVGPIGREDIKRYLTESHALILPTLNENYGHSIVEAAIHSNLLIISNETPWSEYRWDAQPDNNNANYYVKAISSVIDLDSETYNIHSKTTYNSVKIKLNQAESSVKNMFD
ncbi:glycosyltransferase [Vibrio coralliilyticus]|uniref:glycosyltransferase n=1 Tax=Vibrio coralliilyticus TaxID=190893 RepID=UPI0039170E58